MDALAALSTLSASAGAAVPPAGAVTATTMIGGELELGRQPFGLRPKAREAGHGHDQPRHHDPTTATEHKGGQSAPRLPHGRQATGAAGWPKTPVGGNSALPDSWSRIIRAEDSRRERRC